MSTIDVLNTPTAVEDVRAKAAITMKVVKDGQMIIIRNGVCYNAVGAVIE